MTVETQCEFAKYGRAIHTCIIRQVLDMSKLRFDEVSHVCLKKKV